MLKIAVALLGSLLAGSATAVTILTAMLTTGAENPPTVADADDRWGRARRRPAVATFILNDAMTAMAFNATIFNIDVTGTQTADVNDNLSNAHIHASPTATAGHQRRGRVGLHRQSVQR